MPRTLENILKAEIDPAFAKRAEMIFETIENKKPSKVLDAGCGRGFYVSSLTNFSFIKEIHGFDVNEKYLKIAKQNCTDQRVKIQKADIFRLPYPSGYFDAIICSEVLEHLEDDKKLTRVLKAGGIMIITVPNYNFPFPWDPINWLLMRLFNTHVNKNIWWLAGIWADHERLYTINEIKQVVKKYGLHIKKQKFVVHWCWPFSHFMLYGIGKNLVERFGLKIGDRFSETSDKTISSLAASLMSLPSRLLDRKNGLSSVNIFLLAEK